MSISAPITYLYVPGDRPERLAKAFSRGAGAIIADLEDAVDPASKEHARDIVLRWISELEEPGTPVWVRLNSGDDGEDELRRFASVAGIAGFLLPKVENPETVERAYAALTAAGSSAVLAPMIESATGLVRVHEIAAASGVAQLHIGEMDLCADLGVTPGSDESELLSARSLLVVASKHAGLLPPAAPVTAEIDDARRFRETTERLKRLGFVGRDCIHPAQVAVATEVFQPTEAEIAWASDVLRRAETEPGAFRDASGQMVDEAILRRARAIRELGL